MAILQLLDRPDIYVPEIPAQAKFRHLDANYLVEYSHPEEIRMDYFIRTVKVFNDRRLLQSGETPEPAYLNMLSPDNRFLFVPFRNNFEILDLQTQISIPVEAGWLEGNHFDPTSRYFLLITFDEIRLMDLWDNKVLWTRHDQQAFIGHAQFGPDHRIWMNNNDRQRCFLQRLDPVLLTETTEAIPSPFEFFHVDPAPYRQLLDSGKHCL